MCFTFQSVLRAQQYLAGDLHIHQVRHQAEVLLQHFLVPDGPDGLVLKPSNRHKMVELIGQGGNL